ncbi:flavodoxin [Barnesiella propionica]|uniref:flavodoxin n=1 Tax=Barnesiella propionica TaxID=2981781 RepID=UPI0021D3BE21|nr:flavodoxin [Barnesiella propionica]MCU6769034.1 flavodoxin [Barnesiella propionica]
MEKKILLLLAWLMLAVTGCSANDPQTDSPDTLPVEKPEEPTEPSGNRKILIVYFSHTGNTRTIAGYIHDTVKSDLVEIETVDTYTDDYDTLLAQIREEVATEYCPPLTTRIEDIDLYDVIFIGYPIWVETAAPPIRSFLTTHDLAGKTVVPFCTSGTSSAEASYRLIRSLCPQSTVLEGIQIRRGTYDTAYDRVIAWLQKIGIVELNQEENDER